MHEGNAIRKRNVEISLLEFRDKKELCRPNMFQKEEKRKITDFSGGCGAEINFVLVEKKDRKYVRDVEAISRELSCKM